MKISLNWAQQYSNIDLKSLSTKELVTLASERLGGIEGVIDLGKQYDGVIVAKVVSCIKHPNADKLSLCKVDDGGVAQNVQRDNDGFVQVVCGAPNVTKGLLVAWIPPGSAVPASYNDKEIFTLEARELRGEISNGMLASPAELNLSDDHNGILEIEEDVKPGTPFKDLYSLDDVILEIENKMFTHRPDGFGQLGVARELAGIQQLPFKSPDWYVKGNSLHGMSSQAIQGLSVVIEDGDLCPRYMAVAIDNVKVGPSPVWLQSYLKRVGVRPINNVVDITNYMMMLTAQPLHAFDFDKISKNGQADIIVRRPKKDEKMTLLDGKEIEPHADAVLICNPDGPIALGGIMGGGNSEVDEKTTRVVLECANFNMYNIRRTSMIHGLFTEAVTRFNKNQSIKQLPPVLFKAVQMFEEFADANMVGKTVDAKATEDELPSDNYIEVTAKFINERLGSKFNDDEIVQILTNVELEAHVASGPISVTPPFWRTDIEIKEDIVEEVGRLHGFNRLPVALPNRTIAPVTPQPLRLIKQSIRQILSSAGANEVLTYSFVHGNLLTKVSQKPEDSYALRNALSPDLQYYRQTLTPNLLDLIHSNIKADFSEFALFELGKTHNKVHGEDADGLPKELNMMAFSYANKAGNQAGYYHARRYLDYLATKLGLTLLYAPADPGMKFPVTAPFELSRSALVTIKETETFLGIIGEYRTAVSQQLKLPASAAGFEIDLEALVESLQQLTDSSYQPLSRFPSTEQDLTLKISSDVAFSDLEDCLREVLQQSDYQWNLQPLSAYQKDGETKNLSFRLKLAHPKRTLTTKEVNELVKTVTAAARKQLKAELV